MVSENSEHIVEFNINDKVEHPKWGLGVVMHRSGSEDKAKVVVQFYKEEKLKTLMVKYAKLKKVASGTPPKPVHKPIIEEELEESHTELDMVPHVEHLTGISHTDEDENVEEIQEEEDEA
ncbi:MAG: hypothetical protein N3A72_01895 [bacterium]|nr:hypothetical protein [bacterium]